MKYLQFILSMFFLPIFCNAQITKLTLQENMAAEENVLSYDSLESICETNYKQHIGQTLYLIESKYAREHGGYSMLYRKKNDFYPSNQYVYKPVLNDKNNMYYSDYNYMKGRYFLINNIIMHPESNSSIIYENVGYLQLVEKETKDTLYYCFHSSMPFREFITVGYFEKLKSKYTGKEYVYVDEYRSSIGSASERHGIRALKDGREIPNIAKGTVWKCIDISVGGEQNEWSPILPIISNDTLGNAFVWIDDLTGKNPYKFKSLEEHKKILADNKVRKTSLMKKYGQSNTKLILEGKVKIGWSKTMCIESWGEPDDINRTTGSYGIHEQWVYEGGSYLYFENGKLSDIQN